MGREKRAKKEEWREKQKQKTRNQQAPLPLNMSASTSSLNKSTSASSFVFLSDPREAFRRDGLGREILGIALPAVLILAANPVASKIHMAIVGLLGSGELNAVEASNTVYNLAVNVLTFALASITASFVTKEKTLGTTRADRTSGPLELRRVGDSITNDEVVPAEDSNRERQHVPSAATALAVAWFLGVLLMFSTMFGAETFLVFSGVESGSTKLTFAETYLTLRSIGAPASLLSCAMQGVFVGLMDTRTPLFATGELANIALHPMLIFVCDLGVSGAAIAHAVSQYLIFGILLLRLIKKADVMPPSHKDMHFCEFIKKGLLMFLRGIALISCSSFASWLASGLDPTPLGAFLMCLKIWMASSVIADGLAVAGQAILASALAKKDYDKAKAAAFRVLQMGFVLGLAFAAIVGVALFGYGLFSEDVHVEHLASWGILFVIAAQAMNSLACVFDGVYIGASDLAFSAYSMVLVSIISLAVLYRLSEKDGLYGIWVALTLHTCLRTTIGLWRTGLGIGPWRFLREGHLQRD